MNMLHDRRQTRIACWRGQSLVEYAVLITVGVAVLLSMQVYMKRGISGRFRAAADSLGGQYAPKETTANFTQTTHGETITASRLLKEQEVAPDIKVDVIDTVTTIKASSSSRTGTESVGPLKKDIWE